MKINENWHKKNPMPSKPTLNERIQWHADHARECACRPIPDSIRKKMSERKPKLVVGVLARYRSKYLLVRESLEGGRMWWIIPGGKVEFGERIEEAARREIDEETGIVATKLKYLSFYEAIFPQYNYHTVIFFYEVRVKSEKLRPDIEGKVLEARWFNMQEIKKLKLVDSAEWLFKQINKN